MNMERPTTMNDQIVLSLFPGIDLLGRGFELEGFCIVRGPDLIFGGDVRMFHVPHARFDGVIAGTPCQDFSKARRTPPTGYGDEMLSEFSRLVTEAQPTWFLLENVPTVPNVHIDGYTIQRLDLNARECGAAQRRPRHFQFGSLTGLVIVPARATSNGTRSQQTAMASEGHKATRRGWPEFCELQGLPHNFDLPGMTRAAKYAAVGNGVHIAVARTLARAIVEALTRTEPIHICGCNCGRIVAGRQTYANAACRKRMQRRRERDESKMPIRYSITEIEAQRPEG